MAIMRSKTSTGGASWLGIKTGTVHNVIDETSKYDWADLYLVVEFMVEGSEYPRVAKIVGSFDKEPDGRIKDCTLLKRITFLLEALGEDGGVNQHGQWVTEEEQPIDDIASYLTNKYKGTQATIYVFKELAKNGQAYTRVHNKILAKTNTSEAELKSYIDYLKSKGFLKEAPADSGNGSANKVEPNGAFDASGIDIANL